MIYDILIIGGGIAGVTAAIYARMAGLNVSIVEKEEIGGELNYIDDIYNFPGFVSIKGKELAERLKKQLNQHDIEVIYDEAKKIKNENNFFQVETYWGVYVSRYLILATGSEPKKLDNVKASYCEMCEGHLYKNKNIAIIGSGDSAFNCALYMSNIAKNICIIMRNDKPKASKFLIDKVKEIPTISIFSNSEVKQYDNNILTLTNNTKIEVEGIFAKIGDKVNLKPFENIINNEKVFLIGDCRGDEIHQLIKCSYDGIKAISIMKGLI